MILLEAIACKVPIVCSDIPENIEIVGKDYPYLFHNKDSDDLKLKIEKILNDTNINYLVNKLFNKVINEFNWVKITQQYETLYKHLKSLK